MTCLLKAKQYRERFSNSGIVLEHNLFRTLPRPLAGSAKAGKPALTLGSKWRVRYSRIMQCNINIARAARFNRRHSEQTIQRYETISVSSTDAFAFSSMA
jgi:hypothetical protein